MFAKRNNKIGISLKIENTNTSAFEQSSLLFLLYSFPKKSCGFFALLFAALDNWLKNMCIVF